MAAVNKCSQKKLEQVSDIAITKPTKTAKWSEILLLMDTPACSLIIAWGDIAVYRVSDFLGEVEVSPTSNTYSITSVQSPCHRCTSNKKYSVLTLPTVQINQLLVPFTLPSFPQLKFWSVFLKWISAMFFSTEFLSWISEIYFSSEFLKCICKLNLAAQLLNSIN